MKLIEETLRAVLADRNIPPEVATSVLNRLLDHWNSVIMELERVRYAWQLYMSVDYQDTQLVGPRVSALSGDVRIARVMALHTFLQYYALHNDGHFYLPTYDIEPWLFDDLYKDRLDKKLSKRENLRDFTKSRLGITWACLERELQDSNFEEIESSLGLYHMERDTPLVAVSYTVYASELHIPTILDARLQPGFVPKSVSRGDIPRAWDWDRGKWGISEMVHRSGIHGRGPKVRLLGKTSSGFRPSYEGLASFTAPCSSALEFVVAQALRQVLAHKQLEPFLSGEKDLLEITPNEFEHFVACLYSSHGYVTSVTKASRDGGIDVIAFFDSNRESGLLIQAKYTRNTVGIQVIRELVGARFLAGNEYRPYMLVVTTTGRFSRPAIEAAQQHPTHFWLLDYDELQRQLRMIKSIGFMDIVKEAVAASRKAQQVDEGMVSH